eukprot:755944-Hanusia_phi.AAC.3
MTPTLCKFLAWFAWQLPRGMGKEQSGSNFPLPCTAHLVIGELIELGIQASNVSLKKAQRLYGCLCDI